MKYLIKDKSVNKLWSDAGLGLTSDKKLAKIYDDDCEQDARALEVIKKYKTLVSIPVVETIDEVSTTNFSTTGGNSIPGWANYPTYVGFGPIDTETFPHPYCYAWERNSPHHGIGTVTPKHKLDLTSEEDKLKETYEKLIISASGSGGVGVTSPNVEIKVTSEEGKFKETLLSLNSLLDYKNKKYGNAALEPLEIFEGKCKVGQRLDDKLARIKNSEKQLQKNDVADLIGYLTLVCVENGWNNFDEFKD
jgi:hypothetical protein